MKAVILLGTLKKGELSTSHTLSEFLQARMEKASVNCEIIKLVDYAIPPGTCTDMGDGDEWPSILKKIAAAEIVIFATPIWWGMHSSETQKAIERLDEIHDKLYKTGSSELDGKAGGIVVTGDGDGAEHVIGCIANFCIGIGITMPAYATLSVLSDSHAKGEYPSRQKLLEEYEKDYGDTADKMIKSLKSFAEAAQSR